jgi:amino acid adenylation domain-containing protein
MEPRATGQQPRLRSVSPPLRVEQLVTAAAARRPTALAVDGPDATLTYAELDRRSDLLARRLRSSDLRPETPIGLCLERSAALIVGALGILKAGAAYVALDPGYPDERLRFMLRDSGTSVVVTTAGIAERLDAGTVVTPPTETVADGDAVGVDPVGRTGSDLAYVIYTSGSTGTPKGVLVEHASLLNLVRWHQAAFGVTAGDRGTQLASPGFDAAVWEIWPYLTAGASIHIPGDEVRNQPASLRDWIVSRGVTVAFLPTALAEAVITLEWPGDTQLRYLLTGGDALHRRPADGLPFTLVNNYGVTEATVVSTSGPVGAGAGPPTIGRPITGVHGLVVDDDLHEVPAGEAGELVIGGVSVARGYLHRPALTRERFVTNPATGDPADRLYRTGDLVRRRADGEIEFLGRLDDQVKIRGFRIELGEIAATLDRHPAVRSSTVVADGDDPADRRLFAYVVPAGSSRPGPEELRTFAGRYLPQHMLPAGFSWLAELPVGPNGKVDRAALAAGVREGQRPEVDARPRSALEEQVAAMVAGLLGLDAVGTEENFFLLGGHSLLGAQLIVRLGDRFGVEMTLRSLFDGPTVAGIASEVERLLLADVGSMSDDEAVRLVELDRKA